MINQDKKLYSLAKSALKNSYAPYSKFAVGAALLTKSGEVFTGSNIENSSLGATICAERVAFSKAVSSGEREFDTIAIVSADGAVWPCGICRQFMFEFGDGLRIITGEDEDHLRVYTIGELLPEGFRLKTK